MSKYPAFNIENRAPVVLAGIFVVIHLVLGFVPQSFKAFMYDAMALAVRNGDIFGFVDRPLGQFAPLILHIFLHSDWLHVGMNSAFTIIFGVITIRAVNNGEAIMGKFFKRGPVIFILIFLLGSIGGGIAQWLVYFIEGLMFDGVTGVTIGASSGGYALFICAGYAIGGTERMNGFAMIGLLFSVFTIVSSVFNVGGVAGISNVAWAAHLGGLGVGYILAPKLLVPNSAGRR